MAPEVNGFVGAVERAGRTRASAAVFAYYLLMEMDRKAILPPLSAALVALREGRLDAAEKLSTAWLCASPGDPAAHQLAAAVALQQEKYSEAEAFARACLTLRPGHAPALKIAGRAALGRRDWAGAKSWFRRLSDIMVGEAEPIFQLCLAQIESADPEAQATLKFLADRFPKDAAGWRDIGVSLMRARQLDGAEAAFRRAADASNDFIHTLNLGRVLLARGGADEAIPLLRLACAAAPHQLEAWLPLAQALRQSGSTREAREILEHLAIAQPNRGSVFYALGLVCDDARDWPGAIAAYKRCTELQPDMPEAYVNLGLALQQVGELERALDCYRRAVRLRPDTFGRIAQALPSTQKGILWLDTGKLRRSLHG
jgi:protein O-GlcNAc transferase